MTYRLIIFFLVALPLVADVELRRGAIAALQRTGSVMVTAAGEDPFKDRPDPIDRPVYFGGIFNVQAGDESSIFFRSSSGMDLYFVGPGFFGLDRNDQIFSEVDDATGGELQQSRMILSLREGGLILDSRQSIGEKQILLETPFGRIGLSKALCSIVIGYDYRSRRYDFTIYSAVGTVQLTDWNKESYTIYSGQRLAGAGSYLDPSVEIGGPTEDALERMQNFSSLRQSFPIDALEAELFRSHMVKLNRAETTKDVLRANSKRRPVVVEFAPAPDTGTFFRAVIPPRDEFEEDLF